MKPVRPNYLVPFFAVAFILCPFGMRVAEAHTIETDGDIQGVMHVSPSHEPTAGEKAEIEFFMHNTKGSFDPSAYTFTLAITGEGMATATPAVSVHGSTLTAEYTFLHAAEDDTATLTGSSTVSGQPSFALDFDDIHVLPQGQHEDPLQNLLEQHGSHVALVAVIIIAFAAIVCYDRFVVRRRKA